MAYLPASPGDGSIPMPLVFVLVSVLLGLLARIEARAGEVAAASSHNVRPYRGGTRNADCPPLSRTMQPTETAT